jgi:hypothetical protein
MEIVVSGSYSLAMRVPIDQFQSFMLSRSYQASAASAGIADERAYKSVSKGALRTSEFERKP